jgi:hypothetical protein
MDRDDERLDQVRERGYEPPRVEDVPTEDGPAVTAAGKSPPSDAPLAAEWRL